MHKPSALQEARYERGDNGALRNEIADFLTDRHDCAVTYVPGFLPGNNSRAMLLLVGWSLKVIVEFDG